VKKGEVVVSNGPLAEARVEGGKVKAVGSFFRPMERLAIVRNGKVFAEVRGDGRRDRLAAISHEHPALQRKVPLWLLFPANRKMHPALGEPEPVP